MVILTLSPLIDYVARLLIFFFFLLTLALTVAFTVAFVVIWDADDAVPRLQVGFHLQTSALGIASSLSGWDSYRSSIPWRQYIAKAKEMYHRLRRGQGPLR